MGAYYFDTSALVKRYAKEVGSAWVVHLTQPSAGHEIFTVLATGPEMIAALYRKVRTNQVSQLEATQAALKFRVEWRTQYQVISFTADLADEAMTLAQKHGLRGYDSVHLSAAVAAETVRQIMSLPPLIFVSSDREQLEAATNEGFVVEDPNSRP